jgi:hypothetical protein
LAKGAPEGTWLVPTGLLKGGNSFNLFAAERSGVTAPENEASATEPLMECGNSKEGERRAGIKPAFSELEEMNNNALFVRRGTPLSMTFQPRIA